MIDFLPEIVTQHAEEAAFLWILRYHSTSAPNCTLVNIEEQEERIAAHLDGIRLAPEFGWGVYRELLPEGDPGDIFGAAVLAIESGQPARIGAVMTAASQSEIGRRALVSALDFVSETLANAQIRQMKTSGSTIAQCAAIDACAQRHIDPGAILAGALSDEKTELRTCALRCAGELGGRGWIPLIREHLASADLACRFWAAWSGARLGDTKSLEILDTFTSEPGPYRLPALELIALSIDHASALDRAHRYREPEPGLAIALARMTGDLEDVPWLLDQMSKPELTRQAGEAFSWITGADLDRLALSAARPADFDDADDDPPSPDLRVISGDKLPWPCVEKIGAWWQTHSARFPAGQRLFEGRPSGEEHLRGVLRTSRQTRRAAAALDLAVRCPEQPLFMVGAVSGRQKQWLTEGPHMMATPVE